jgi:hypothetical protein
MGRISKIGAAGAEPTMADTVVKVQAATCHPQKRSTLNVTIIHPLLYAPKRGVPLRSSNARQVPVAHAYNPSYLEDRDQEDCVLKPTQEK